MALYAYLKNTQGNHNKFYEMIEDAGASRTFTVKYGRIGSSPQTTTYNIADWNKKYDEKIKKGYVDITRQIIGNKTSKTTKAISVNQEHLEKVNKILVYLAAHENDLFDSKELIRDVSAVRAYLLKSKTGELQADDMIYLNDVWKKIKPLIKK